jgi:dGTPase
MRDRDRIIHSAAFRRLEYKTQVFVYHEGDHYRTRLTHTIEVAQVARTIARALGLNEDLAEAIALSHDLGHPPFGHSGERALKELVKDHGGFEHNVHGLRIVDHIERRYPTFRGLNLTWEVREAIAKHSKVKQHPSFAEFAKFAHPSLEAQAADLADSIAYNSHDLEDGLTSQLLQVEQLTDSIMWRRYDDTTPLDVSPKVRVKETIKKIVNAQVTDVVETTRARLADQQIVTPDDARRASALIVGFSQEMAQEHHDLKVFLRKNMYSHYRVIRMEVKAGRVVRELFEAYNKRPEILPTHVQAKLADEDQTRLVCDYIAGMTDKFALEEHDTLFNLRARV